MADDIVTRLRDTGFCGVAAQQEAADEIERLRAEVARRPVVTDSIVTSLRLLSHPFLGAAGISATERNDLRQAATTIEQLQALATELAEALEAILDNPGEYGQAFTALSHWHHRTCCPATPAD